MGIIVLILVSLLVFTIMRLLPGDPLMLFVAQADVGSLSTEQMKELRHEYGLDKPVVVQYLDWIWGVLHGDFGVSIFYRSSVRHLIAECIPITLNLGVISFIVSAIIGVTFGVICAIRRGTWLDTIFTVIANLGITLPAFWIGILLIYLLALKLHWLPTYGYTSPFVDLGLNLKQIIMPVICLSIFPIASLTRQTRSSMLEVIGQDYIRTAWAKGLRERTVIIRHTLKNAFIPVVTTMGMHVNFLFGGAVIMETVFNIPGMGRLMRDSVFGQDYQVVQGGVLIIALIVVLTNIVVDISYGWFDPRIRYG